MTVRAGSAGPAIRSCGLALKSPRVIPSGARNLALIPSNPPNRKGADRLPWARQENPGREEKLVLLSPFAHDRGQALEFRPLLKPSPKEQHRASDEVARLVRHRVRYEPRELAAKAVVVPSSAARKVAHEDQEFLAPRHLGRELCRTAWQGGRRDRRQRDTAGGRCWRQPSSSVVRATLLGQRVFQMRALRDLARP